MSLPCIKIIGCEWEFLDDLATNYPELITDLCMIHIELHISTTLGMATSQHLSYIDSFWQNYILNMGFRVSGIHTNPGGPENQFQVHPVLVELGLRDDACCYELVLHRLSCLI
jgi:hypothetical protein